MDDDAKKLTEACRAFFEETDPEAEAREKLEKAVESFRSTEMARTTAAKKQRTYQNRGAEAPMIFLQHCERIGREVYFIDYDLNETSIPDACLEASRVSPRCPYARECEHYKKDAIGRKMSGCIKIV